MPIQRIIQPEALDESGRPQGEPRIEEVEILGDARTQEERRDAILAEAQRDRVADRYYGALNRSPSREPLTAEEAIMATKEQEARDREMAEREEQKLSQQNAVTAHAGVVKMADGKESKLIPTPENYALESEERSEGIEVADTPPLAITTAYSGNVGLNKMDEAELRLKTGKQGSTTSAQHATGTSEPEIPMGEENALEAVAPLSEDEAEKLGEGAEARGGVTRLDGSEDGSDGDFNGSAEDLSARHGTDALRAEAERRGLTVTRADKKEGAPLKSDYAAALAAK